MAQSARTAPRLAAYFKPLWPVLLVAGLAVVVRSVTEPALAYQLKPLIEATTSQGDQIALDVTELKRIMVWLLWIGLATALSDLGSIFCFDYAAQRVVHDLRRDLFRHIQSLSLGFFEGQRTGELMSRATNDLSAIQARLNVELTRMLRCPLTIVLLVATMLRTSPTLSLICGGVIAVLVPLVNFAGRTMRRHSRALQDRLADLSARLQESISGIRVVQCFGAGAQEIARFDRENADARRAVMRTVRVRSMIEPLTHLVGLGGLLAVFGVGGLVMYGRGDLEFQRFAVVAACLQLMTTNFKQFGRARLAYSEVLSAADKVFGLLDARSDIVEAPDAVALGPLDGRLRFESVDFAYATGELVLRGIDLDIAAGETVAVVGPSGSGKSSLANLIPRLYDPSAGRVTVDGHDLRGVTLASLRGQMGIVPQQTMLFSGTVRYNIAYGKPDAADEEVEAAARLANADSFIRELPEGYDTEVGERGMKLSGGQAQRIAIARAVLRDPRILILDEATSSLDSESEAAVQEALERLMHGRTTLVIAHRLGTVQHAARIVVLDHGRITASGSHEELLASDGHYRRAFQMQGGQVD